MDATPEGPVIRGEDSESDEEFVDVSGRGSTGFDDSYDDDVGDADDLLDPEEEDEIRGSTIAGEASESEEELMEECEKTRPMLVLKSAEEVAEDPPDARSYSPKDAGESESSKKRLPQKLAHHDTLFHQKLVENQTDLRTAMSNRWRKSLDVASGDLSDIRRSFTKTLQASQDTSHSLRLLTNDLFRMEDAVDIIATCELLPKLKFETPIRDFS